MPSLLATKLPLVSAEADAISLAPSLTAHRGSRIGRLALADRHEYSAVLPNATAVLGAAHRAVESTKPSASVAGSAEVDGHADAEQRGGRHRDGGGVAGANPIAGHQGSTRTRPTSRTPHPRRAMAESLASRDPRG